MSTIGTLIDDTGEGSLPLDTVAIWHRRGFTVLTEEQASATTDLIDGLLIQKRYTKDQLHSRITNWLPRTKRRPLLILLVGDQHLHGLADYLQAVFEEDRVDVVRLVPLADREHAVIGGDSSSEWVRILRQRLAEEGIISLVCRRIEADEVATCLPLYQEWKHRFYMFMGERCDHSRAKVEVVAWALGMDKRIGQGWFPDRTAAFELTAVEAVADEAATVTSIAINPNDFHPISLCEWVSRELHQLRTRKDIQTLAVWSDGRGITQLPSDLQQLHHVHVYITKDEDKVNALKESFTYFSNLQESLIHADALLILDANQAIRELPPDVFVQTMGKPVILDACSCYPLQEMQAFHIAYRTIGQQTDEVDWLEEFRQ